eukprot:6010917-Alexandrium_andersonii.AAC.1
MRFLQLRQGECDSEALAPLQAPSTLRRAVQLFRWGSLRVEARWARRSLVIARGVASTVPGNRAVRPRGDGIAELAGQRAH